MRPLLLAVILFACLVAPAWADFRDGWVAFEEGDYATAFREWKPLAKQGDASAQYNLGHMYYEGKGVPQDFAEAFGWFGKAAAQGEYVAQFNIGVMYQYGTGAPQDDAEAVKWFRKAAEQGSQDAQNNLGYMYGIGRGVPQDNIRAHMWYNLAAAQGNEEAKENRDILAESMTAADLAKAQRLAREWLDKHQAD